MVYEFDFGAAGEWHVMASGGCCQGILVVCVAKMLAEKPKEWVNSSVMAKLWQQGQAQHTTL